MVQQPKLVRVQSKAPPTKTVLQTKDILTGALRMVKNHPQLVERLRNV